MVMIDPSHIAPFRYEHTKILNGILGKASVRITIEDALVNKTWRKCGSNVDLSGLGQNWKEDMTKGGSHVLQDTWVTATDPHYDAMLFPCLHPYGTGSLWAEPSAGGTNAIPRLCKSRLLSIQSAFRDNTAWSFFQHQRLITSQMFNQEKIRQQQGRRHSSEANSSDPTTRLFGTVVPSSIPESTEWWKVQSKCLFAISDDSELGIMQEMVTITVNDGAAELISCVRRGPFAIPVRSLDKYVLSVLSDGSVSPYIWNN